MLAVDYDGGVWALMAFLSRYSYMIDNIILLITGTLHERDTHELLERCHPLGVFESMPALCVATTVEELYQSVLVETPLGESTVPFNALCMTD